MKKFVVPAIILTILFSCGTQRQVEEDKLVIRTNPGSSLQNLEIEFFKGEAFNHPSFAIWIEDVFGNYIETLFVTEYVGSGKFARGESEPGKWKNEPGEVRRPSSLPYWSHKRNVQAQDGLYIPSPETAVPDAISSATPKTDFTLETATSISGDKKFRVLLEINQPWDSNNYWTNNKFPGDNDYFTSLQPSLIYAVTIDQGGTPKTFYLNPIGHGHPSGKNGELFTDLSTVTTAKEIADKIIVRLK